MNVLNNKIQIIIIYLISFLFILLLGQDNIIENEINIDNNIIINNEPIVSRYASSDGHAIEAIKECYDRHHDCDLFVSHGECQNNPGWMIINCPLGCNACHLRDSKVRCSRNALNISEESVLKPGTLNNIFERIIQLSNENKIGKVNIISNDPWILEFENFITPIEAKSIITAVHDWERSTDTGSMNEYGEQGRILSTGRTSTNAWCRDDCESKPNVQRVLKRIESVTTVPIENYESFQVLKYDIGQYYRAHHDTGIDENELACGMRILTFFLYLSDVEIGGETSFPLLNLSVKPKLGKAVLWPGVYSNNPNVVDHRTRHEAKPVIKGVKYGANSWIHSHNFRIPNLWGCTGSFD